MALVVKPVRINRSTYLRVPQDVEELVDLMGPRTCTVDTKIDEKGCSLVYTFAKPVPDPASEFPRRPLWLMEKELVA
jgi:hypothetical protein